MIFPTARVFSCAPVGGSDASGDGVIVFCTSLGFTDVFFFSSQQLIYSLHYNDIPPRLQGKSRVKNHKAQCTTVVKQPKTQTFIPFYFCVSMEIISFRFGITFNAPFRVVMIEEAALANRSISYRSSYAKESSPFSRTVFKTHAIKVSPAPVVSIVSSRRNGSQNTLFP